MSGIMMNLMSHYHTNLCASRGMRNIKEQRSQKTSLLRMRYRMKEERDTRNAQYNDNFYETFTHQPGSFINISCIENKRTAKRRDKPVSVINIGNNNVN